MIRRRNMDRKHKGAWAELVAASYLLSEGFEVFRNVSPYGPIDMVVYRGGEVKVIDVKSVAIAGNEYSLSYASISKLTDEQVSMGVVPLFVVPDGYCTFDPEEADKYVFDYWTHGCDKENGE